MPLETTHAVEDAAAQPAGVRYPCRAMKPGRSRLGRVLAAPFVLSIRLYQLALSPWIGGQCRFIPSCSAYAIEAYQLHGPIKATWLTFWRLCRCHPLGGCGYDPPPLPKDRTHESSLSGSAHDQRHL